MSNVIAPIPLAIFTSTFHKFSERKKEELGVARDAFYVLVFFMECYYRQDKSRVYCTDKFGMEKTGLTKTLYRDAKALLREMGHISKSELDKKSGKYYFRLNISKKEDEYQQFLQWRYEQKKALGVHRHSGIGVHRHSGNNTLTENIIHRQKNKITSKEVKHSSSAVVVKDACKKKVILLHKKKSSTNVDQKEINVDQKKNKSLLKKKPSVNVDQKKTPAPKIIKNPLINKKPSSPAVDPKDVHPRANGPRNEKIKPNVPRPMSANPYVKPPRKPLYDYTLADNQLYIALIKLGATNHRTNKDGSKTNSYYDTMDRIHQLLSSACRNPYNYAKNVTDEFIIKEWTQEEVIDTFEYYMKIVDESKIYYKNIANFILSAHNGTKAWSPLLKFYTEMNKDNGNSLDGDAKRLHSELERLLIADKFDAQKINKMVRLLDVVCSGYMTHPNFKSTYYDNLIFAYTEYIEKRMRKGSFMPEFAQGESVMQQFFEEYVQRGMLIPEGSVQSAYN